jgi:hypothetical protein
MDNQLSNLSACLYRPSTYDPLLRCSLVRAFVCGRATESTTIGLIIISEPATRIVTTFDICRFQGVTALALIQPCGNHWFLP